jgi:hypothetical protein
MHSANVKEIKAAQINLRGEQEEKESFDLLILAQIQYKSKCV